MGRARKCGIVIAGYALAVGAARLAAWRYDVRVSALPYDTSGGMYAAGQLLTAFAAFLALAVPMTLLMLWWMRRGGIVKALAAASLTLLMASAFAFLCAC